MAASKYDVENMELSKMLNLHAPKTASMLTYDDLYPKHWANNDNMEKRHRVLMLKIKQWPRNDKNEV